MLYKYILNSNDMSSSLREQDNSPLDNCPPDNYPMLITPQTITPWTVTPVPIAPQTIAPCANSPPDNSLPPFNCRSPWGKLVKLSELQNSFSNGFISLFMTFRRCSRRFLSGKQKKLKNTLTLKKLQKNWFFVILESNYL